MEDIKIIELQPENWQRFKNIRLKALENAPLSFLNSPEDEAGKTEEEWKKSLEKSQKRDSLLIVFAADGEKIIGMNAAFWNNKKKIAHYAEIWGVFVDPQYRGRGIGKMLMDALVAELQKLNRFTKLKIGANSVNMPAIKLYHKCGFADIGTARNELFIDGKYYDEVLMEKLI